MADPRNRDFLSHSSKDKDFVRELYRRLTRDGVACFFDAESIGWGENWVKALERAIGSPSRSRHTFRLIRTSTGIAKCYAPLTRAIAT